MNKAFNFSFYSFTKYGVRVNPEQEPQYPGR